MADQQKFDIDGNPIGQKFDVDGNPIQDKTPLAVMHGGGTPLASSHTPVPSNKEILDKFNSQPKIYQVGRFLSHVMNDPLQGMEGAIGNPTDEKPLLPAMEYGAGDTMGGRALNVGKFAYNNLVRGMSTPSGFLASGVSSRPKIEVLPPETFPPGLASGARPRGYLSAEAGPTGNVPPSMRELPTGELNQPRGLLGAGSTPEVLPPEPNFYQGSAGLAENRPYPTDIGNQRYLPGSRALGTLTPAEQGNEIVRLSPILAAEKGLSTGQTLPGGVTNITIPGGASDTYLEPIPGMGQLNIDRIGNQLLPPTERSLRIQDPINTPSETPRPYESSGGGALSPQEISLRIQRIMGRAPNDLANPTPQTPPPSQVLWENTPSNAPEPPSNQPQAGWTRSFTTPEAQLKAMYGNKPVVVPTPEKNSNAFAKWVNWHNAAGLGGKIEASKFEDLRAGGMNAVKAFESGNRQGRLADVAKWFDDMYSQLKAKGIQMNYQEDYLQHVWKDDPNTVAAALKNIKVPENAPFTKERFFDTYEQGIKAGLTPKYTSIPDLIRSYKMAADRAIANKEFYDYLRSSDQLANGAPITPKDWSYKGPMKDQILGLMKNHFEDVPSWFRKIADAVSTTKNLYLGGGIPYTDVNMHKFNILQRAFMSRSFSGLGDALKSTFVPGKYKQYVMDHLDDAYELNQHGLSFSIEDHSAFARPASEFDSALASNPFGKQITRVLKGVRSIWEDPLFGGADRIGTLQANKLKDAVIIRDRFIAKGMPREQALKEASEFTNQMYGGVNRAARGWSKSKWEAARISLLAPDWLLTNVEIAKNAYLSMRGKADPIYLNAFLRGLGPKVVVKTLKYGAVGWSASKLLDVKNPTRSEDIPIGTDASGRTRNITPLGTSLDAVRLPEQMGLGMVGGNLGMPFTQVKNRLSLPASNAMNLIKNVDAFGRPIYGRDVYGNPIPKWRQAAGIGQQITAPLQPQFLQGLVNYGLGGISLEQALSGGLELPLRYRFEKK